MPLRSVIDIDVRDAALDATLQKLAQIQAATKGLTLPITAPGARPGATPGTQQRQQSLAVQAMQRVGLSQQQAERSAAAMAKSWGVIREHVERAGRTMSGLIRQMTSFTGMMGLATGAATLGGMFGMDAIGRMASGLRMRSLALSPGADVGQMQAFGIGARRLGVGPQTLQTISDMMQSPATRGILTGIMGANVSEEMDPSAAAWEVLAGLRRRGQQFRAQGMPIASILQATQANQIGIDAPTMMRMMNMRDDEFNRQRNISASRGGQLGITDEQLKRWQNFMDTIDTAKARIEKTFITGLGDLAEPIGRLVNALTDMLQALLEGPRIRGWLEDLRSAIEGATGWLKDPGHKQAIDDFFASIGNAVQHLMNFASALGGLVDWIATHFKGIAIGASAFEGAKYGAIAGGAIGSVIPGVGTAVGAGVGGVVGAAGAAYGAYRLMQPAAGTQTQAPVQPSAYFQQRYQELYRIAALRNMPNAATIAALGAAQSTLETGGGAHVPGQNYFGIKAGPGEASVMAGTQEFAGGQMVGTTAAFRAQAGAADYLEYMQRRFPAAMQAGSLADAIRGTHGYATDPDYDAKLQSILRQQGIPLADPAENTRQQISSLGRAWRDQNRETAMATQARPVSTLAGRLPTDGGNSARLGNVLITLRSEAGGNAFVSAGAMAT